MEKNDKKKIEDNKTDNKKNGKKKKIIIAVIAVLVLAMLMLADAYRNDRNMMLKKLTKKISLDKTAEVEFDYSKKTLLRKNYIPVYLFTAPEDAEYSFNVTDVSTEDGVYLTMNVCDKDFNEYFNADNFDEHNGDLSGTEYISKGNKCYIIMDAVSKDEGSKDRYTGSLKVTVTKAEEAKPAELKEGEPVTVKTGESEMTSVIFKPAETGYYRFETQMASGKEDDGFSSIALIKNEKNKEVKVTENISYLEGGKEYSVWVSASEISGKTAEVSVSCSRVASIETEETGTYNITGETILEFKPKKGANYAVFSVSDGNVNGAVYDDKGFPLNKNNNSVGTLSENKEDFALVLQAQDDVLYLIHVNGEFKDCSVTIAEYTGDGTSLGPDDIKLPSDTDAEQTKEDQE